MTRLAVDKALARPHHSVKQTSTMAAAATKNIQLALALPTRLRTFLARYPPASILPAGANPETHKTGYQEDTPNPFRPLRHPATGKWHNPKYSLRRQAELIKMARKHGVEELLPEGPKSTEARLRKRVELGLRVKGTGVGQKVKGHKHERQLGAKYVWNLWEGKLRAVLGLLTDLGVQQDGQEETGHAGDAGAHQGMEEGMYTVVCTCGLGLSTNQSAGWKTGLDQVSEISGQISCTRAVTFLDCTNTNVQHSTTGGPRGCGSGGLAVCYRLRLVQALVVLLVYGLTLPVAIGRSAPCQVGNRYHRYHTPVPSLFCQLSPPPFPFVYWHLPLLLRRVPSLSRTLRGGLWENKRT